MDARTKILSELDVVAEQLAEANEAATALYATRLQLLQEGRALTPPITQRELAAHAKVSEEAVIQVLRKAARQAEAATNGAK